MSISSAYSSLPAYAPVSGSAHRRRSVPSTVLTIDGSSFSTPHSSSSPHTLPLSRPSIRAASLSTDTPAVESLTPGGSGGGELLEERARRAEAVRSGMWCVVVSDDVLANQGASCELAQRVLGYLPCLHAAELGTAHGNGNGLVAGVESLNLRNNSLSSLDHRHVPSGSDGDGGAAAAAAGLLPAPCPLGLFFSVTSLDVTNNELTSLAGIDALPYLTSLRAARNGLRSLGALWRSRYVAQLELLEVSGNRLAEIISEADAARLRRAGRPLALRSLAAASNGIREVPAALAVFARLETLRLQRNKIAAVSNSFPSCCPALAAVDLSGNRLDVAALKARAGSGIALDLDNNAPAETTPRARSARHSEAAATLEGSLCVSALGSSGHSARLGTGSIPSSPATMQPPSLASAKSTPGAASGRSSRAPPSASGLPSPVGTQGPPPLAPPGPNAAVTLAAPNAWEVDVEAVQGQLRRPAGAAPRLALGYTDDHLQSRPPSLRLNGITAAATQGGGGCRILVHHLVRAVTMEKETMLARAMKRYEDKIACSGPASPTFTQQAQTRQGSGNNANSGSNTTVPFSALLAVDHTFALGAGQWTDPWPYVRWRREWEAQAAAKGLRLQNRYWLLSGPQQQQQQPVPEMWCRVYAQAEAAVPSTFAVRSADGASLRSPARRKASVAAVASPTAESAPKGPHGSFALSTVTRWSAGSTDRGGSVGATAAAAASVRAWRGLPAAAEGCGTVRGTGGVAWPAGLLAILAASAGGGLTSPAPAPAGWPGLLLDVAMGSVAAVARVGREDRAEALAAVAQQVVRCPVPVYAQAAIASDRARRSAQLQAAAQRMKADLAAMGETGAATTVPSATFAHGPLAARHADPNAPTLRAPPPAVKATPVAELEDTEEEEAPAAELPERIPSGAADDAVDEDEETEETQVKTAEETTDMTEAELAAEAHVDAEVEAPL